MKIETVTDFDTALDYGPYSWPGGYPVFFIMADGEALSFTAALQNAYLIREAIDSPGSDEQWRAVACDINWENDSLRCAHTDERIPSAYGEEV